jgi:prevent-host-death family protein
MGRTWQLQEAKSKLSELVNRAMREGPQIITRHGHMIAVVIPYKEYARMRSRNTNLVEFFRASPLAGVDLDFERDRSLSRPDMDL